jgi:hypothetical protein
VAEGSSVSATVLVLQYLYTSEIKIGADDVMEIWAAAETLQLPKLLIAWVDFLQQSISATNACTILAASKQMNLDILMKACINYILRDGKAVLKSEGFKNLAKEIMMQQKMKYLRQCCCGAG